MLGSPAGPGGPTQRGGLWPLASAPSPNFSADGFGKYGIYSLLPGSPDFGSALYSHSSIGRFSTTGSIQTSPGTAFHAAHKFSDSLFTSTGYTFGAPTPPPGSPYSPVPVTQLELFAKGFNSNIIIQQPDYSPHPAKKLHVQEKRCEEKYCCKPQRPCSCQGSPLKTKFLDSPSGCSRTNPVDWGPVTVKKEPGVTPCQVAEITTSQSPVVKLEVTSPTQKGADVAQIAALPSAIANGDIPVGIAVARQRIQHEVVSSPSLPPSGLLASVNNSQIKDVARYSEMDAGMAATTTAGVPGGGTLLQCHEDRSGGFASWPVGGAHNSALTTPTLWQYPSPLPMEPLVPMPVPMPPVGFQLVRDPNTGGLLLLPTTGVDQIQQTVLWPSYHQPSSHVLLPPVAPPPLQLLSSASDYLQTSTTLHQHTQTHSTRLVALTTDTKRKIPLPIPTTTLIKIETDATLDQTKTLHAVSTIANNTGTVYTDQNMAPLVTTHVIYQHPTNLILSQTPAPETACGSQVTSPVSCLTPPPESTTPPQEETMTVQDASNQTDTPECSEDDSPLDLIMEKKPQEEPVAEVQTYVEPENDPQVPKPHVQEPPDDTDPPELPEPAKQIAEESITPDISGLELLSNSIVEFENCRKYELEPPIKNNEEVLESMAQMSIKDTPTEESSPNGELTGLNLLCALAEQRISEEVEEKAQSKKEKRKSKRHSDEPRHKKLKKSDKSSDENSDNSVRACTCKDDAYKTYKTKESEEEVRKFLASKSQSLCCKGNWPCMNTIEIEMRKRLADLQRKYREKQRELSKLKPKKHDRKHRMRKKSINSDRSTPPPQLDKMDVPVKTSPNKPDELLKPPTLCRYGSSENCISNFIPDFPDYKNLEKPRKSKKRKVGRPKKLMTSSGIHTGTETIVAKKPRKNSIVGFLLAAKEKLIQNGVANSDPPRFIEESIKSKKKKSKIRPKLKAEATIKSIDYDEEEPMEQIDNNNIVNYTEEDNEVLETEESSRQDFVEEEKPVDNVRNECAKVDSRCILTTEHLEQDKLRVLTAMGGLFYAGRLNAVEPPDVYSITLDGERGNRPHIMSREEILRDAIVEVSPSNADELTPGTRLCAYWSQQYRCLYPGSVAESETPDPTLDSKFVSVEFDDGDSGKIAIEDIRLLPPDYPIIEYDPNPLLSLSKRRRRASTTEEKRCNTGTISPTPESIKEDTEKENQDINVQAQQISHRERKRLKKRKKEKLKLKLLHEDKKHKKKHRCLDENCKHRKHHKKHRKHKKHHHSKESSEEKTQAYELSEEIEQINEDQKDDVNQNDEVNQIKLAETDEDNSNLMSEVYPEYRIIPNPDDEVTMDDIIEALPDKNHKLRDRQESCESRSKMSAFLPARQIWGWSGKGYKRSKGKGRLKKTFYKEIQRGNEIIQVGDSAVFLSTGRPDRPYIGHIEAMWESCGNMVVKVKWFYHPEETVGCPPNLKYPGALFESSHADENDVQTISHKCEVLPLAKYTSKLGDDPRKYESIYDNNDIYYLAGFYDPSIRVLRMEADIPFNNMNIN